MCIYIFHTIPLRMMNSSQGINQKKKCILVFWESSTDSTTICSAIVKSVTDHVLMLATTSWVTHLIFLFHFVCFVWSSLLGLSVAVILRHQDFPHVATDPLVCVPSWSTTFSYLANYFFLFCFFLSSFTTQAYLISVPPQSPDLLPVPSTSSMQLFAMYRTRVQPDSLEAYIKYFHFEWFLQVCGCCRCVFLSVCACVCLFVPQTASELTSVC